MQNTVLWIATQGSRFIYIEMPNDDWQTARSILKKVNNIWEIACMQISTGNSDLSLWD